MPKKPATGIACVAVPKDEDKYYQKWHVKIEPIVKRFEMPCVITEATEKKFSLGIQTIEDHQPIIAQKVGDGRSWIIQDTAAKAKRDKKKADKKKAAKTKDTDKEDTSDKEDASDMESASDREGASDKDEAAKVSTYTILKRPWNAGAGTSFNWSIVNDPKISLLSGMSGHQNWTFVKVDEDPAVA